MQLQIKSGSRWREVISFAVEDVNSVAQYGDGLAWMAIQVDKPIELRIVDGMDMPVLATIGLGWHVPKAAEGYTWVP